MAKPQSFQPATVVCESCKKQIPPETGLTVVTNYVHYCGHVLCWDCVKSGKESLFKTLKP